MDNIIFVLVYGTYTILMGTIIMPWPTEKLCKQLEDIRWPMLFVWNELWNRWWRGLRTRARSYAIQYCLQDAEYSVFMWQDVCGQQQSSQGSL